jgi:predicted ATP-dependent endonuclease of OLD family
MKIQEIKIKKYKTIENQVIEKISKFNILVGPNNAGKTNILDSFEVFFNGKKDLERKNSDIELTLETDNGLKKIRYKKGKLSYDFSEKEYLKIKESIKRIDDQNSLEKLVTKKIEKFKINHPEIYKEFIETIENYFQNIQISEDLFKSNVENNGSKEPIMRMGAGFKRLFIILFYLYQPTCKILLIDEPELHLHPSVIKKFLKILDENNLKTTILMTTHHPTFVQAKFLDKIWRISRNEDGKTKIYKFKKKIDLKTDRFIQEINDDNSAMLFSDKVLLVEGISDSILLRGLLDRFTHNGKDIKVVYTGGIGDIELYEKICRVFDIPYSIMVDGDGLNYIFEKKFGKKKVGDDQKRKMLKEKNIFVLKGALENNYPKKYQFKDTKPLNALIASKNIKKEDYQSSKMKYLREVVNSV